MRFGHKALDLFIYLFWISLLTSNHLLVRLHYIVIPLPTGLYLWVHILVVKVCNKSSQGPKQSCRSPQKLSNIVSHSTCTHQDWVNSQLLVVENQTASLTPDFSFDHNLCYRCPNGSCEVILNIYTSRTFQRYK
jgi:hypothetical protein